MYGPLNTMGFFPLAASNLFCIDLHNVQNVYFETHD